MEESVAEKKTLDNDTPGAAHTRVIIPNPSSAKVMMILVMLNEDFILLFVEDK